MRGIVRCPAGCAMRWERSVHASTSEVACFQGITGGLRSVYYLRDRSIYGGREKTMRAIAVTAYGGPEVLQLTEVPEPQPGPGQVVIRVAYAGVNFAEIMGRRGDYPASTLPFVPGLEVSGHIHALGDGVEGLSIGQPVAAFTVTGGYADYVAALRPADVPARRLARSAHRSNLSNRGANRDGPAHRCGARPSGRVRPEPRCQWGRRHGGGPGGAPPGSRQTHRRRQPRREARVCTLLRV